MSPFLPLHSLAGSVNLLLWGMILIPPPYEPDQSWYLLCPYAKFINGALWDIFHSGSLLPTNVVLHWTQTRRLQGLRHQWTLPPSPPLLVNIKSLQSFKPLYGGTPLATSVSHPSLPNYHSRKSAPYEPLPCTSLPMPAPSIPYSLTPFTPSPTAAAHSSDCRIGSSSWCCWKLQCVPITRRCLLSLADPSWLVYTPY